MVITVRCLLIALVMLGSVCIPVMAQVTGSEKPLPEARHLDLPLSMKDSLMSITKSPMPKIHLPEFFITGKAVIDLPEVDKLRATDDSDSNVVASLLNRPLIRLHETAQPALGSKEEFEGPKVSLYDGKVFASLGTFFSPQAGLWFGNTRGDYVYSVDGQYYRTEGFAAYTGRSGGSVDLVGGTRLKSYNPYFDQSKLQGNVTFESDTYNWYGSSDPTISRTRNDVTVSANLRNWSQSPIPYRGNIGLESFGVDDSSKSVSETRINLAGATRVVVSSIPFNVEVMGYVGTVSYGNSSAGLSYLEAMVGSQRYTWKRFSLYGGVYGYAAHGMDNQSILRLYPHFDVAYLLSDQHTIDFVYAPQVQGNDLSNQVFANRYISALSKIRHTDDQQDATLAIESSWSGESRTRLGIRVQSIMDYPLYADSLVPGVWQLAYGGRTTITSLSAEIFAKLPANDYFAAKLMASMSNNSLTGRAVPYLPVIAVEASYTRQFGSNWTGSAKLTLLHDRTDNVVKINVLPSILLMGVRCEYRFFQQAAVFLDVQNLLNEQYEYWRGYQEDPFVLSAGFSLRW